MAWATEGHDCRDCLTEARHEHLLERRRAERWRLTELDEHVARGIRQREGVVLADERANGTAATFGERVADRHGALGWVVAVRARLRRAARRVDAHEWSRLEKPGLRPLPFIRLNLVLSCLAALQAPSMRMSQNRAEARDRERAESDDRVNLEAEIEVAAQHEKRGHVLHA